MKRISLVSCYLTCCSLCVNAQWQFINTGTTNDLYTVKFTTKDTGFIAGYATFLQTFDGGNSWVTNSFIDQNNYVFYDIDFPTKKVGYVVGGGINNVAVFKTIDGGQIWSDVSPEWSSSFYSASFLNKDTGFICGLGSKIYRTVDGGLNWQATTSISLGGSYYRWTQFTSIDTGFICSSEAVFDNAKLLKTIDGGLHLDPIWFNGFIIPPLISSKNFQFLDNQKGYAGINGINKTIDGGNAWIQLSLPNNSPSIALYFLSDDTGYVAGDAAFTTTIYKTFDGGNSWYQCATPYPDSEYYISEINFSDRDHGFAVGSYGLFMKTDNGGGFVGIQSMSNNFSFSIYPNPATNLLHLYYQVPKTVSSSIVITNLLGEQLLSDPLSGSKTTIDITSLASGIYLITWKVEDQTVIRKFMKE